MCSCGNRRLGLLVVGRNRLVFKRVYGLAEIFVYEEKDIMDYFAALAMTSGDRLPRHCEEPGGRRGNPLMSKKLDGLAY